MHKIITTFLRRRKFKDTTCFMIRNLKYEDGKGKRDLKEGSRISGYLCKCLRPTLSKENMKERSPASHSENHQGYLNGALDKVRAMWPSCEHRGESSEVIFEDVSQHCIQEISENTLMPEET